MQEWAELRDIQEQATREILAAHGDVIITAATASGKTEAAFLPLLTRLLANENKGGLLIYISPLKALINDQFSRLTSLCEMLDVPVWPWHGDISQGTKARFLKKPAGVLLITPEALEALLCNRGAHAPALFAQLEALVIDELHAFIGEERGKQLQSLLHRIESAAGRTIQRVGLSATLGDMRLAAEFMRTGHAAHTRILSSKSEGHDLRLLVKGYLQAEPDVDILQKEGPQADDAVVDDLYRTLRGSNNLIFPNTRALVERYASALRTKCEEEGVPNEFWPHHGSLSREMREDTERALKSRGVPATAVCTNTLELGIDIGDVKSVAQVGPPHAVASLRQRLGRSGRRAGTSAILRAYCVEPALTATSHVLDELREGLVQTAAMITLLLEGWFEPPKVDALHASTLIQQLMSLIAQKSGVMPQQAYHLLCKTGPFASISSRDFAELLRQMGKTDLLMQDSSGALLHGKRGEVLVNHYSFYAAFADEAEYRIVAGGRTLGSMPISSPVFEGSFLLFGGRNWRVTKVELKTKTLSVEAAKGGKPPRFVSSSAVLHTQVRQRMREVLAGEVATPFLDATAQELMTEARSAYARYNLAEGNVVWMGSRPMLFTWQGDATNDALVLMLKQAGIGCQAEGPLVEIQSGCNDPAHLIRTLKAVGEHPEMRAESLLEGADNLEREKWDAYLPPDLLKRAYASLWLDISGAQAWARNTAKRLLRDGL